MTTDCGESAEPVTAALVSQLSPQSPRKEGRRAWRKSDRREKKCTGFLAKIGISKAGFSARISAIAAFVAC
jgi:hypothetical protein